MKPVAIRNGRVSTETIEVNAVWHCNLRCRSCSHGSPAMEERFADPSQVLHDLRRLRAVMVVEHVRVVGGEPLLHPQLPALLLAIKRSEISPNTRLLSNGVGLESAPDEFWQRLDEVHVSVYPATARRWRTIGPDVVRRSSEFGVPITVKRFEYFRESFRPLDDDHDLTERIYSTCQVAHSWRCLTVERGVLYPCPQSTLSNDGAAETDGLALDSIPSADGLAKWIAQESPRAACSSCTGSAGTLHVHEQQSAGLSIRSRLDEGPVDHSFIARLEHDPDSDNGCVVDEYRRSPQRSTRHGL